MKVISFTLSRGYFFFLVILHALNKPHIFLLPGHKQLINHLAPTGHCNTKCDGSENFYADFWCLWHFRFFIYMIFER